MSLELVPPLVVMVAGLVLCFAGYVSMRWILTIIGGFAGWRLGGYMSTFVDFGPDFKTLLYWGAAILLGLLLATLAFAFYTTGVLIAVGAIGYLIGSSFAPTLGFSGIQTMIAGTVVGLALVVAALLSKLPKVLLVVLTSVVGAASIVLGTLHLIGALDVMTSGWVSLPFLFHLSLPWYLVFFALLTAGIFAQLRGRTKSHLKGAYA
jgi:hypothetical protein